MEINLAGKIIEIQFLFNLIMAGVIGLMVGSFLNVCIYRIPRGRSIVMPGSACPECGHMLAWWENIPLISWVIQGGRCRRCKVWISPGYFTVELLTGAAACLLFWEYGGNLFQFVYYFSFFCFLTVVFFIDLEHWIIPDTVNIAGIIIGVAGAFFIPVGYSKFAVFHPMGGLSALAGAAAGFIFFGMLAFVASLLIRQEAMGYGDVKFAALIGAYLGLTINLPVSFIVAFFLGGIFSIPFMIIGKKRGREPVPFGTFMAAAAFIALLWGEKIFEWYRNLFGGGF